MSSENIVGRTEVLTLATGVPNPLSFDQLKRVILSLDRTPDLDEVDGWLEALQIDVCDLRSFTSFKPGTYARHLVVRGEFAEMLILCWRPGQKTPIHDHNGSIGGVKVLSGVMWETLFQLDENHTLRYARGCEWNAGFITGANVTDIHQLGNPEISGQDLISIHIYAPPLGVLNTYKVGTSEMGQYSPNDYTDGAGI